MCKGYYCMEVNTINSVGFCATLQAPLAKRTVNRSLLKAPKSELKQLCGPEEKRKAKAIVASATASNALISAATAQAPGADLLPLKAVETTMVASILNGVYNFNLGGAVLKGIAGALLASSAGQELFKIATKTVSWIPLIGNCLNSIASGSVTASLGALIIEAAEAADKARRQGKDQDEIIKILKEFIEKMKE